MRRRAYLLATLCYLWPALLLSQIYRYQDEQGNWHFTDDPPDRYESSVVPDITTSKATSHDALPENDLAARLQSAYSPITPIAYATMTVVSIKTGSGEGSGFFCSEDGHILTNKHVIRPEPAGDIEERERTLQGREGELESIEMKLDESRGKLVPMKQDLARLDELIESARDESTRSRARDAKGRISKRYHTERKRISSMKRSIRTLKGELRDAKRELHMQRSAATGKSRFDIVLKDGTELAATIQKTSVGQDLALLKVDGYRTPFLRLDSSRPLPQGTRVFAIGNPLGMQDAVTSGVVTQVTPAHILTDAQILPGSSGGPLILETGEVIGINVSRKVAAGASQYAAGFSKVIPIALALREFPSILTEGGSGAFDPVQAGYADPPQTGTVGSDWAEGIGFEQGAEAVSGQPWSLDATEPPKGEGTGSAAGTGLGSRESAESAPVRLVIPDQDDGQDLDAPAQREPRSLDFPPEGSGSLPPPLPGPQE